MAIRIKKRLRQLRAKIRRFSSRKISNRLILTNVALGAIPLVVVGLFLISLTANTVESYIHQRNLETARRAGNDIALFLNRPFTILQTTAFTQDIVSMAPLQQNIMINKLKKENQLFNKLFVVNDSGKVIATTRFGEENSDVSQEVFYRQALADSAYFSDVYFTGSRFPVMLISEPIRRYGKVAGALAAEVDLESIWSVVDSIHIGKTGLAFLLSEKGEVIAHPDKAEVLDRRNFSSYGFFSKLREGISGVTNIESRGEPQVAAFVPIFEPPWGVVVLQSEQEAFMLASEMQRRIVIALFLTMLSAVLLGIFGVKRFTRPLLELVRGVREYAGGNLSHKIEMNSKDEIALLAQEFNSMATSLMKNQRELQRMERLASLSRFAALVSHEVRNPLNSMNINMQILKRLIDKPEVDSERKIKYLDVISSEITRINDMVTNFLTISRPPELQLSPTDIHSVIDEIVLLQEARAAAEGVELKRIFCESPLVGRLDYNQLKQVFINLINNALEAMNDSGTIFIETSIKEVASNDDSGRRMARVSFRDTGEGIPEEILAEVFEFYYTTKRAGTGLGLAIAKQIVEGHGGSVYIETTEQIGTSVIIDLPIGPVEEPIEKQ
ncbi:MAG: cache domain-containing protein [Calditrichia bacterium]